MLQCILHRRWRYLSNPIRPISMKGQEMRFSRVQAILVASCLQILVPVLLVLSQWTGTYRSVADWAFRTGLLVAYMFFIYLAGSWVFVSYYTRSGLSLLSVAAIVRSLFYLTGLALWDDGTTAWIRTGIVLAATIPVLVLLVGAIRARHFNQSPVELSLPFGHGVYSVFEGGNGQRSSLMNYHYGFATHGKSGLNNSMRYGVPPTMLRSA